MERGNLLALISKIVVGATLTAAELDLIATAPRDTPVPRQVGSTEVAQLRSSPARSAPMTQPTAAAPAETRSWPTPNGPNLC